MTKFVKENFSYHGGYLSYYADGPNQHPRFVARFKYAQTSSKGAWITHLIKNFMVEEYFALQATQEGAYPTMVARGFMYSHIKKWLRDAGYPITQEGYHQWSKDQRQKREIVQMSAQT